MTTSGHNRRMSKPGQGSEPAVQGGRSELEAKLHAAETRYGALVGTLPAIIYTEAAEHRGPTLFISPQVEEILGVSQSSCMEDHDYWASRLHPDDREDTMRADREWRARARPGDSQELRYRMVRDDGRVIWFHDKSLLLEDETWGRVVQGVMLDITEHMGAQLEIAARDRIMASVGNTAQLLLRAADWREVVDVVLRQLGEATGVAHVSIWENVTRDDGMLCQRFSFGWHAPGLDHTDLLGTLEPLDGAWAEWTEAMSGRKPLAGLSRDRPPGERAWFDERNMASIVDVPVFSDEGWWGVVGFDSGDEREWLPSEIDAVEVAAATLGAAISRQQEQGRFHETEIRYRALVEQIPAVLYIDHPGLEDRTAYISPQIADILGLSAKEWLDEPNYWYRNLHPDDQNYALLTYRRGVAAGRPFSYEYRMLTPRGLVWIRDDAVVIREEDGMTIVQGVMFDVTEQKLAEEALLASETREREAAERLRALDQMKNAFLAAVSHELRSPLTTVLGLAVTLDTMDLAEPDRTDLLHRLAANAKKLERLLADLLDIDRLSRGVISAELRPTDLKELVERTAAATDFIGRRTLEVRAQPVVVAVDAPKVERILENLLVNAARHTPEGTTVWVRAEPYQDGALLAVEDDGPGVADELKEALFDPFRQGPTRTPHAPGTGIGLTLVRQFVDLHGGSVWITDRDGGGASVRVYLPDGEGPARD